MLLRIKVAKKYFYINLINCLLCIFLLYLTGCTKQPKAELQKKTQEKVGEAGGMPQLAQKKMDFSILLDKLKKKNPFSKDHSEVYKYKFAFGTLTLSGIFYDAKKPLAIINDKVAGVGDMVDGKIIIQITQDEVILKDKEKEYRLKTE